MRNLFTLSLFFLFTISMSAQNNQTVRGQIVDKETKITLPAVVTLYKDSTLITGASADFNGNYKMENVPIGRYTLLIQYLGYNSTSIPNLIVASGKESIVNVE